MLNNKGPDIDEIKLGTIIKCIHPKINTGYLYLVVSINKPEAVVVSLKSGKKYPLTIDSELMRFFIIFC